MNAYCRSSCFTTILAAALFLFPAVIGAAHAAEAYPSRPIRMIVPYPPGGSTDPTGRAYAAWLTKAFGQQVVVDNRPGAGATIGHGLAAKATPDGYTILLGTSGGLAVAPALGTGVAYDPVKDFTPIGLGVYAPFLLVVNPQLPIHSLKELIDYSRKRPDGVSFASVGVGSPNHLGGELLKVAAGFRFVHVPYKGGGPAVVDVIAGRAHVLFGGIPYTGPHVKAGRLRAIAIGHPTRVDAWPGLPAVAETVPGFTNTTWFGLLGPAGMPKAVVARMNAEMRKANADPGFLKLVTDLGLVPAGSSPEEFGVMIRDEFARWKKVIREAGITAQSAR